MLPEDYLNENRSYFTKVMNEAPNYPSGFLGVGRKTCKGIFRALVVNNDMYFLPLCLHIIYHGVPLHKDGSKVEMNEKFARTSLKLLHEAGISDIIRCDMITN